MKKNLQKVTIINNIVCAVLLVVLVGTMFMPFWDYTAEIRKDVRICRECDYVHESKDLEDGFTCPNCGAEKKRFKASILKEEHPDNASVMEFTWLTYDNKGMTKMFEEMDVKVNDVIMMPFVLTICAICGVIFAIANIKGSWHSVFPCVGGIYAVITYLTNPVYQMNSNWIYSMIAACVLSVAGLALFAQWIRVAIRWFTVPVKK